MEIDILKIGGNNDGKFDNSEIIQKAIDECSVCGGKVIFSNGIFLSSPFRLKSNVEIFIDKSATLLASPDFKQYKEWGEIKSADGFLPWNNSRAFIFADCEDNIAITGGGKIDCNGENFIIEKPIWDCGWKYDYMDLHKDNIPREIFITGCSNVKIQGITLVNSAACWSYWINACTNVVVSDCKIFNNVLTPNSDGFHFNCCSHVEVNNCELECGDDCIVVRANSSVFKDPDKVMACENIFVHDCRLTSYASAIRIGWISDGVVKNCTFKDIIIKNTSVGIGMTNTGHTIKDRTSDQGKEYSHNLNLLFENIEMNGIYGRPILYNINEKAQHKATENIIFKNITGYGLEYPLLHGAENVRSEFMFENCEFIRTNEEALPGYEKHGCAAWDRNVSEKGFYAENVSVKLKSVKFTVE